MDGVIKQREYGSTLPLGLSEVEIVQRIRLSSTIVLNLWRKHYHNYINGPSELEHFWWMAFNLSIDDLIKNIDLVPMVYLSNNVREIAKFVRRVFRGYRDTLIAHNMNVIAECSKRLEKHREKNIKYSNAYNYMDYVYNEKKHSEDAIISLKRWNVQ